MNLSSWMTRLAEALAFRPRRASLLPIVSILIGSCLAGVGILRPAPPSDKAVPPGYAALVNGRPILLSDFITQTETEMEMPFSETTSAVRAGVLHQMIDQELLVQRGLVLDLPEASTEVRQALVDGVSAQVDAPILAAAPSDDALLAYYRQHRADYAADGTMQLRDIVLHIGGYQNADQSEAQAEADAAEAVYDLRSGATLDHVMQHFGFVDSGRADSGDTLDFAAKIHLGPKLYKIAATLNDGDVSDPVSDTDGVHVLIMAHRVPPHYASYDAARSAVYTAYRRAQTTKAEQENIRLLRSTSQIVLAPGQQE